MSAGKPGRYAGWRCDVHGGIELDPATGRCPMTGQPETTPYVADLPDREEYLDRRRPADPDAPTFDEVAR